MSILWVLTWLLALSVYVLTVYSSLQSEAKSNPSSDTHDEPGLERQEAVCTSRKLTKLKLLTVLPYPDNILPRQFRPSWDQGDEILPAIELAAEQINNIRYSSPPPA